MAALCCGVSVCVLILSCGHQFVTSDVVYRQYLCVYLLRSSFKHICTHWLHALWPILGCVHLCVRVWQVFCVTTHHPSSQMGEWQEEQKQIPRSGKNKRVMPTNDKCLLCACERERWRDVCVCVFSAVRIWLWDCVGEIEREKDKANECWETWRKENGMVFLFYQFSRRTHTHPDRFDHSILVRLMIYLLFFNERKCSHALGHLEH